MKSVGVFVNKNSFIEIPNNQDGYIIINKQIYEVWLHLRFNQLINSLYFNNSIDATFEMILKNTSGWCEFISNWFNSIQILYCSLLNYNKDNFFLYKNMCRYLFVFFNMKKQYDYSKIFNILLKRPFKRYWFKIF